MIAGESRELFPRTACTVALQSRGGNRGKLKHLKQAPSQQGAVGLSSDTPVELFARFLAWCLADRCVEDQKESGVPILDEPGR